MSDALLAALPNELLSCIIQSVRPSGSPVAVPAKHVVTQTLLNLTRASSRTRSLAIPYLYTYCLYIDSPRRLELLLRTLSSHVDDLQTKTCATGGAAGSKSLGYNLLNHGHGVLRSLYLAPFEEDTIDDPPVVKMIASLFKLLSPSLARLVINMALRSLYPEEDSHSVRPLLREAFQRLTALEEFTSVQDELFLDTRDIERDDFVREPPVWSLWPRLKHLALYNVDIDSEDVMGSLRKHPSLKVLVLTRADGEREGTTLSLLTMAHLIRVLIVNTASCHPEDPFTTRSVKKLIEGEFHNDKIVEMVRIVVPIAEDLENEDITVCQTWTRENSINGNLWNFT
jgi:hypothetical protein